MTGSSFCDNIYYNNIVTVDYCRRYFTKYSLMHSELHSHPPAVKLNSTFFQRGLAKALTVTIQLLILLKV